MGAQPKKDKLLQLPGRGGLDFRPLLAALRGIAFAGPVEIFMHPLPRSIPILPIAVASTAEINCARAHLEGLLQPPRRAVTCARVSRRARWRRWRRGSP